MELIKKFYQSVIENLNYYNDSISNVKTEMIKLTDILETFPWNRINSHCTFCEKFDILPILIVYAEKFGEPFILIKDYIYLYSTTPLLSSSKLLEIDKTQHIKKFLYRTTFHVKTNVLHLFSTNDNFIYESISNYLFQKIIYIIFPINKFYKLFDVLTDAIRTFYSDTQYSGEEIILSIFQIMDKKEIGMIRKENVNCFFPIENRIIFRFASNMFIIQSNELNFKLKVDNFFVQCEISSPKINLVNFIIYPEKIKKILSIVSEAEENTFVLY
jgi:hypothetical protein